EFCLQRWQLITEELAQNFALSLAKQLDDLRIDARLISLFQDFFRQERRIVHDGAKQLAQLFFARAAIFVIARDQFDPLNGMRAEDRQYRAATDSSDARRPIWKVQPELEGDLAAH